MAPTEKPILSDPMVTPDEGLLNALLGEKMRWWQTIVDQTMKNYPSVTSVWRYYNDGKQWLFRLLQKKNTIFWCSLIDDTFRITFYFPDRAENLIEESELPVSVKEGFMNSKKYGKIKGITVKMIDSKDIDTVLMLISLKLKMK